MIALFATNTSTTSTSFSLDTPSYRNIQATSGDLAQSSHINPGVGAIIDWFTKTRYMLAAAAVLGFGEGVQHISEKFAEGYLKEDKPAYFSRGTVLSIGHASPEVNAESTKERLFLQLIADELTPLYYQMEDESKVVEFIEHKSRLVCVFDHNGLQLLWQDGDKMCSEMLKNDYLDYENVSQRVALILHSSERRKHARSENEQVIVAA